MLRSQDILVPEIYNSLNEALEAIKKGKKVIIRSEHPDEYAGAAGLLSSYNIDATRIEVAKGLGDTDITEADWENLKEAHNSEPEKAIENKIFATADKTEQSTFERNLARLSSRKVNHYCDLLGIKPKEFFDKVSYSYWEKIEGLNRSAIADSAIPERYHIFSSKGYKYHNYAIIDKGKLVLNAPMEITDELKYGINEVIEFYEKIRNMEGFDPKHCPIIEFQTHEDKNYFLQYHRTREMEPSTWELKRNLEEGEIEATYARGVTPPEGITLEVAMYYPPKYKAQEKEDASFDFHYDFDFSEIMSRRRIVNFSHRNQRDLALHTIDLHLPKSKLFNSKLSISIDGKDLPKGLPSQLYKETKKTKKPARVKIRVVSDGRKAYVKFLE
ncbi:MAG TPA: hypothetical protein VGO63_00840 [Candidatus Paceibacterota bacterium]|jgi:hypothetical protein|nr:hypothetical protein [Candidatus Paceibacterota bacterium]